SRRRRWPRCTTAATATASRPAGSGTAPAATARRAGSAGTARAPCRACAAGGGLRALGDRQEQVVPRGQLFLVLVLVVVPGVLDVGRGGEHGRGVRGGRGGQADLRLHLGQRGLGPAGRVQQHLFGGWHRADVAVVVLDHRLDL